MVYDLDDVFAQEALCKQNGWLSFSGDDLSLLTTALERLSERVSTLKSDFVNLVTGLIDELESLHAASADTERKIERHHGLVLEAEKVKKNAVKDVDS